jgi:hypothetical protein
VEEETGGNRNRSNYQTYPVRWCSFFTMDSTVLGLGSLGYGCCAVLVFRHGVALEGAILGFIMLLGCKPGHTCDVISVVAELMVGAGLKPT